MVLQQVVCSYKCWVAVLHAIWFPALHGRVALLPTVVDSAHIFSSIV
jgi:hypothetical protein